MDTTETDAPTVGRQETPEARLVISAHAPRADWLAQRRNGITATDLVAIMGQSNYRTAFDIWTDKVMEPKPDEGIGEAGLWGQRLEDPVAQEWAERRGVKIRRIGLVANDTHPWALASLDRIVNGCADGRCALEVKTRSLFVGEAWAKSLPEDVETQVRWQLLVTGLDHIHVAALIGGQKLVEHVVGRDADAEARLFDAARLVWDAVQSKEMPNLPPELWTSDFLEKRHPERVGAIDLPAEAAEMIADYQSAVADIKELEDIKAKLRTRLVGLLGDAEAGAIDGRTVYTFKATETRRLDSKALAEHYPDVVADDRLYNTTTTRTMRVSATKKGTAE